MRDDREESVTALADTWVVRHGAERDRLLAAAVDVLRTDERFVAAWLGGSFGRGNEDGLSDVDLAVVVAEPYVERLCQREHQVGAGTTPDRLAVFRLIGEPAIVHENHNNALVGRTFTACVYAGGVMFDWVFVPAASAVRPPETRVLFDSVGIPIQPAAATPSDTERLHRLSEQVAFFWMMVVPTTKVLLRGELVAFHQLLDMLYRTAHEVEHLLTNQPSRYVRWSRAPFVTTASEQRDAIVEVCQRMNAISPAILEAGATVPEERLAGVKPWLDELPHSRQG